MPLVLLRYSERALSSGAVEEAKRFLPPIVSDALSTNLSRLLPSEVDIWAQPMHELDVNPGRHDLQVVVLASDNQERRQRLEEMNERLRSRLFGLLLRGSVTVFLGPATYGEFEPPIHL